MNQVIPDGADDAAPAPPWFDWAIAQTPQARFVQVNDNSIHYLEWNGADTGKPVLLFVHGLLAHAHWWDFIAPFFMEQYRVIAIDLSGMGDSGWRPAYSATLLAQDISGLIEALGLSAVTVVAHSYGGLCALRAASMRPTLFAHLIVLDTFVLFEGWTCLQNVARAVGGKSYANRAAARLRYRLMPPQPEPHAALLDHVAFHSLRECADGVGWKFDHSLNPVDIHLDDGADMLSKITLPVDFVYGGRSALVPAKHAQLIVDSLPQGREPVVIAEAHHHLMLDQPQALIATVKDLLAREHRPA